MAMIADQSDLSQKPNLHLNAHCDATDVAALNGIGPVDGNVFLVK